MDNANLLKSKKYISFFDTLKGYHRIFSELTRALPNKNISSIDPRLLILVWEFAPAIAGGVYRPAALARYANQTGRNVTVVTAAAPSEPSAAGLALLDYVGSAVDIERFNASTLTPSFRLFPQIDGGMLTALDMIDAVHHKFHDDTPRTIIASGPPFCSFVAGLMLSRNPNTKLILEYRDEWTSCPFDFVSKTAADFNLEKKCLDRANIVIFTTESQRTYSASRFGTSILGKSIVIPNGWEPRAGQDDRLPTTAIAETRCVLTFAGKLGGHTNPDQFLKSLGRILKRRPDLVNRLLLRFVGAKTPQVTQLLLDFPFSQMIESIPVVPLVDAARMMRESDALLLFHDPRFHRYLPGKLYEYAASGTQILLIDDNGESDRLVNELNLGWSVSSSDDIKFETIIYSIIERHSLVNNKSIKRNEKLEKWLAEHTREVITRKFLDLLSEENCNFQ